MPLSHSDKNESVSLTKRASRDLSFAAVDLVYVFCLCGLLGTVYELILTYCTDGVLENRSGSVLTVFNYVYGIGAVVIFLALHKVKSGIALFLLGSFLGGAVEYGVSFFLETFLDCSSWDYSAKPLNINGRTTVPFMLVWGMLCFLAIRFMFPKLLRLIHSIPAKGRKTIGSILLIIICADIIVSLTAVVRYVQRSDGIYFQSKLLRWADSVFNDTFMRSHFPNMKIT